MLESLPHLAAEQVPTATDGEFRKRREEAVRKHLEAGNRHDLEASVLTFHHPRYDVALSCQRRLNLDPLSHQVAGVKLPQPCALRTGEREGDFPPRRSMAKLCGLVS